VAFRRKGAETVADFKCWCGGQVVIVRGEDTDKLPYEYVNCTNDIFHDPREAVR
jgi:predicted RNA-binding Zn-ribbon protein involved in translation (DUF1610 family)